MSWKKSVWFRLTVGSIAIILLTNAALSLVILLRVSGMLTEEVQTRVRVGLNSARKLYDRNVTDICLLLRATAARRSLPTPLASWDRAELQRLLQHIRQEGKLDMLSLLDTSGRVIYRENNPAEAGDDASYNPIVSRALREKKCVRGTAIIPWENLVREGESLSRQTSLKAAGDSITPAGEEEAYRDGMVIGAAVTLVDLERGGECVGFLYGARLLNQSYEIVDEIKGDLFQDDTYRGVAAGAATVFQGGLRITTSMKNEDGSRAIGTRLSPEVNRRVLEREQNWADRALVVDEWYITAYEPIVDAEGQVIGALGVGMLETPFVHTRRVAIGSFLVVVAATTVLSLLLLTLASRSVLRPIGRIVEMSDRVAKGDLSARVRMNPPGEMGLLCRAINQMADAVAEREEALEQRALRQIGQSEKLASVGRMAAGIAHEINNPLTGLLTFVHLLKSEAGITPKGREYLEIMHKETSRIREIVRGLLDFARESPGEMTRLDVNEVIHRWLLLLRNQRECHKLAIEERLTPGLRAVQADANQIQQVLVNLSLNACEAMPEGGTLTISSREEDDEVVVSITDTGCGIKEAHLSMIFDPFFTTKPVGQGTGLGLSVSYGIIRQHGGTMKVTSREGHGSTFTFTLPVASD
ncbi:cache domain-containing protein [Candidatus Fermentibacteria bacterium]|nr:cache domain-containing protein [Candidatus Fermentibacteria bacterium]